MALRRRRLGAGRSAGHHGRRRVQLRGCTALQQQRPAALRGARGRPELRPPLYVAARSRHPVHHHGHRRHPDPQRRGALHGDRRRQLRPPDEGRGYRAHAGLGRKGLRHRLHDRAPAHSTGRDPGLAGPPRIPRRPAHQRQLTRGRSLRRGVQDRLGQPPDLRIRLDASRRLRQRRHRHRGLRKRGHRQGHHVHHRRARRDRRHRRDRERRLHRQHRRLRDALPPTRPSPCENPVPASSSSSPWGVRGKSA